MSILLTILIGVALILFAIFRFFVEDDLDGWGIVAALLAVVVLWPVLTYQLSHYNERTLTCTVTEKDRGYNSETGSSNYRIYTDECGTFENTDSIWWGKFDSADLQGELEEGQTYELRVAGVRNGFFSMFPNIYEVDPVE